MKAMRTREAGSSGSMFLSSAADELDAIARRDSGPPGATHKGAGLAAQITPIACPCCSQLVPVPTLEIVIDRYGIPPWQASILGALWRGRGMPVMPSKIFDAMYAEDPDGGPSQMKMYAAFKEALARLRKRLVGSGYSIESAGYRRGYRLVMGVK